MSEKVILKGAQFLSDGKIRRCDIFVSGDNNSNDGAVFIDCSNFFVCPGLVDVHVHLREPGFEAKETIATGTASAARGGFTTVCAMPNLNPVPDSLENLKIELEAIEKDAVVNVLPYASITKGRKGEGEIVDMQSLKPFVAGFSDDGCGVQTEEDMRKAMQEAAKTGSRIVAHCEVNELLKGGYIHDGEYCRRNGHNGICSESEWKQIERDCRLAEETGCAYHVCHVSTKEGVEIIREAKKRGVNVTAETCPHYLLLTDEDLQEDGRFKMNPPLREAADRDALIKGIEDGTIDCIVTDHAPHTAIEKSKGLSHSAMGIVGLETSFPLMYTHFVKSGRWSLGFLIEKMSLAPRRIFGIEAKEDFAVFDLNEKYTINPEEFLTKGRATPFAGWEVYGKTKYTIVKGNIVYRDEIQDKE